jgi:hypothetical protein
MGRESLRFLCPERAETVVGREALAGFEPPAGILNADEIGQVASELVVGFVVEPPDGCVPDGPIHALDLTIGPRMPRFGQSMVDDVLAAGVFEGVCPERFSCVHGGLDVGCSRAGIPRRRFARYRAEFGLH